MQNEECRMQNEMRAFDEAAFDAATSKPNGWSEVPDPVAEVRRMRGDAQEGNAAALREALELCVREMCAYCRAEAAMTMPGKECFYGCEALRVAKAALAAPARNCDRYANTAQALGAYPDGPQIGDEWDDADWMMFLDWLFAPAEGGRP